MFWALLEVLRAQPDYTYPVANIPIIARKYNADPEKLRHVVFDFGLFSIVDDRIFFSNGLTARMRVIDDRRKRLSVEKVGSSPWVFPSPNGGPISPDSVLHMLHRVLKRVGLPKVRFHDLRHTFATLALQNGVDIKTVSGMLGHFSAGFTLDTYAHVTSAAQRQAAQTMGNVLSGSL